MRKIFEAIIIAAISLTGAVFLISSFEKTNYDCKEVINPYKQDGDLKAVPSVYIPRYVCDKANDYKAINIVAYLTATILIIDLAIQFLRKPKITIIVSFIAMIVSIIDILFLRNQYTFALEYISGNTFNKGFMIHIAFLLVFSVANFAAIILNLSQVAQNKIRNTRK